MDKVLSTWAGLASHFIGECFAVSKPFINEEFIGLDPFVKFVSAQLYIDCHLTSESSLILINAGKEWDADLISRSVMEGTIKYIYMMYGDDEEKKRKSVEYWNILPEIASVKKHNRAKAFLEAADRDLDPEWQPIRNLILPQEEIERIMGKYNKKERRLLEQKWSFSEITRYFAASDNKGLKLLVHLAHGYGMSSHFLHKDGDGIGMVWDRDQRDPERRMAAKLGHSARVVSDMCTFAKLRCCYLLKACNEKIDILTSIEENHALLFKELHKASSNFMKIEYGLEPEKPPLSSTDRNEW